uniref:NADH-ubiquinone oxidoreductase chain 4L n=1 Tax=Stereophaedusa mima TaxID=1885732 RepID=A0A224ACN5_9EUPU|nr:NADH dehydrogenase subunit 4L [Stereophaedusa mima]
MLFSSYLLLLMVVLMLILLNSKRHFMRAFLILEVMMLTALLITINMLSSVQLEPFMFLTLLTFAVIEAGLGLSLLLSYIKVTGSDVIKNYFFK